MSASRLDLEGRSSVLVARSPSVAKDHSSTTACRGTSAMTESRQCGFHVKTPYPRLRASRTESFEFRIRFVFTVCHGFLPCGVTIFDPFPIESPNPPRTGLAQLTHPAPSRHLSPVITLSSPSRLSLQFVPGSATDAAQDIASNLPN